MPEGGFSGVGHSVGRFRGSGACRGLVWLLVGSALFGRFGRVGVGESVGVGWGRSLSVGLGLPVSGNSQKSLRFLSANSQESSSKLFGLTLRKLSGNSQLYFAPAWVPAFARIPK